MKLKTRKRSALSVTCILCVSLFAGCGTNQPAPAQAGSVSTTQTDTATPQGASGSGLTPAGTFPISEEKQEFSIMMVQWADQDPENAWVTSEYEKMTNVHVNWNMVPDDAFKERVAISFASGDLPDAIAGMGGAISVMEEQQYAVQGLLAPLNNVIERSSVEFKKHLETNPAMRKLISQDDGNIYSLPNINVCYHCNYSQKMFINKVWLDNLGLPMPTTTDEYYQVLKAFKEKDANGNGNPNDEIPLITCTEGWHVDLDGFLMCAFIYSDPDTKLSVEDGKLIFTPTQEGYREGLRYLNKLYSEGLISPESFTNDNAMNTKLNVAGVTDPKDWKKSPVVIGSYPYAYENYHGDTDMYKQYDILPPLKGPSGFVTTPEYSLTRDITRCNLLITKNAKNPDLIMRWVDWFYSDDGTFFRLGREGVEWRKADSGEVDLNGNPAKYALLQTPQDDPYYNNVDFTESIPLNYSQEYRESVVAAEDWRDPAINFNAAIAVQLHQGTKAYQAVARDVSQSIPGLTIPSDKTSDYSRIKTELETFQKDCMVKFITGTMSLDNDWETYKNRLAQIGLEEYLQISNEAYQAYLNR